MAHCPHCGATLATKANSCWLCFLDRMPDPVSRPALRPPAPVIEPRAAYQFGLSTLLLTTTLFAVICGAFAIAPGIGVALVLVVTPALVRTAMNAVRGKVRGRPMSVPEKLGAFIGSVGVVLAICLGAGAAFVATCLPAAYLASALSSRFIGFSAIIVGITCAILGGAFLFREMWPNRKQ